MSYSVCVDLDDAEKQYDRLNEEFRKVHNMDFRIDCNFLYERGKLKSYTQGDRCEHGLLLYPKQDNPQPFKFTHLNLTTSKSKECTYVQPPDFKSFITAPCHWDYDHMIQTEKDIQEAADKLSLKVVTRLSY